MKGKNKTPLILGVGIPLLLIVLVFLVDFLLPSLFIKPEYDFVYATGATFGSLNINKENIEIAPCSVEEDEIRGCLHEPSPNFYVYYVEEEESVPISLEEVNSLTLDVSEKAPDGYLVSGGERGSGGFFPFFYSSGDSFYLSRGKFLAKQVNLRTEYYNFKFIGWVLNE